MATSKDSNRITNGTGMEKKFPFCINFDFWPKGAVSHRDAFFGILFMSTFSIMMVWVRNKRHALRRPACWMPLTRLLLKVVRVHARTILACKWRCSNSLHKTGT